MHTFMDVLEPDTLETVEPLLLLKFDIVFAINIIVNFLLQLTSV